MLFEADFSPLRDVAADVVMFTKEVEDPSALGIAVVEDGRIVRLVEKPQPISNLAVIGIYYVRHMPDLYAAIEEQMRRGLSLKNEYFIADAIQLMIDAAPGDSDAGHGVGGLRQRGDLAWHQPLPAATAESDVTARSGSVIVAPSFVADDAVIENSVVGPFASIGRGVMVRESIVRDSIIEERAQINGALLDRSIVGRRASISGLARGLNVGDDAVVGV